MLKRRNFILKTSIFKRSTALFLAFLLCFTTIASSIVTPASAAGTESEVYLIGFPRDGDVNYRKGTWGHENLIYMNGWSSSSSRQTIVRTVGTYTGPVCYCIEPGVRLDTGDKLVDRGEDFWDNYPASYNKTITPDDIKLLIGRIMQYGYTDTVSTNWLSQNEGGNKLAHAMATQLLIWETVVGERDAAFNKVSTGGYAAVIDQISADHPLRDKIMNYYNSIAANVQTHSKLPSFFARSTGKAQDVELTWDSARYSATLTDTNNVLGNYTFSASAPRVYCSVSGNKLTIIAETTTDGPVTITAAKNNAQCRGNPA